MAIGEFGGAPRGPGEGGFLISAPMYWFYEMSLAALNPSRAFADATKLLFRNPLNPLALTTFGKSIAAACEVFERSTRRYGRPEWDIRNTLVGGERVPVSVETLWERPFCRLLHFARVFEQAPLRPQPRLLIVATMSTLRTGPMPAWSRSSKDRSISTITSITSSQSCIFFAATFTSLRSANPRCRCLLRLPAWRRSRIPMSPIPWC